MLHQPLRTRIRLRQCTDGVLFLIAFLAAYLFRAKFASLGLPELETFSLYVRVLPAAILLGPLLLASQGFYDPPRPSARLDILFVILRGCTFAVLALIAYLFLIREQRARSVIILWGALGGLLVYIRHEVTLWLDHRSFSRAQLQRRVLWIGRAATNAGFRRALSGAETAGLDDAGDFDPSEQSDEELRTRLHDESVNVVILDLTALTPTETRRMLDRCGDEGVEILVRPGLEPLESRRLILDRFGGEPVLYYRARDASPTQLFFKQLMDYCGAAFLLLVLAPLLAILALVIRLSSPGPVLYRQSRAGLNGRPFTLYKFRSMRAGAEQEQAALADQNEMKGPVFKVKDDPRITAFGRFMRRHSLDELPQLWNVLRGEMSLVGPRPLPIEEVKRFDQDTHRRRLSVKPGLTCLWQVSGRNEIADFTDWVRLDLQYIDEWTLWLDCKILAATVPVALLGRGGR